MGSKLTSEQVEQYAEKFLPRAIALAKAEAKRLRYSDVEEFESIAVAELGATLIQYATDEGGARVWKICKIRITNKLRNEVRDDRMHRATLSRLASGQR